MLHFNHPCHYHCLTENKIFSKGGKEVRDRDIFPLVNESYSWMSFREGPLTDNWRHLMPMFYNHDYPLCMVIVTGVPTSHTGTGFKVLLNFVTDGTHHCPGLKPEVCGVLSNWF